MSMIDRIDLDNGSFPLAKDILRVLAKTKLSSSHMGVIFAVLDKTYGWHDPHSGKKQRIKKRKTEEFIKYAYFKDFTGLSSSKLSRLTGDLEKWRIINRSEHRPSKYCFNPNVNEWDRKVFRKRFQKEGWGRLTNQVIPQKGNLELPNQGTKNGHIFNNNKQIQHAKETIYKEREKSNKKRIDSYEESMLGVDN